MRVPPLLVLALGQGGWHRCGSRTGGGILMVGKFMLVVRRLIFRFNSVMTSLPCTKCHSLGHCEQCVTTLIPTSTSAPEGKHQRPNWCVLSSWQATQSASQNVVSL